MSGAVNLEAALKLLEQDPPKDAVERAPKGGKYLQVGYVRSVMQQAFGLLYSARITTTSIEVYEAEVDHDKDVNKRTGEVKKRWDAYAVAHCAVSIGLPGSPMCVREDVGFCEAQRQSSRSAAAEIATKGAASDAFKRACYSLGRRVGLGLRPGSEHGEEAIEQDEEPDSSIPPRCERGQALAAGLPPVEQEPAVQAARSQLGGVRVIDGAAREAIRRGDHPGMGGAAEDLLPPEPPFSELTGGINLAEDALQDLEAWPGGDRITLPLLRELHEASVASIGETETERLWAELGRGRGEFCTGYAARLFVVAAGAVAESKRNETRS